MTNRKYLQNCVRDIDREIEHLNGLRRDALQKWLRAGWCAPVDRYEDLVAYHSKLAARMGRRGYSIMTLRSTQDPRDIREAERLDKIDDRENEIASLVWLRMIAVQQSRRLVSNMHAQRRGMMVGMIDASDVPTETRYERQLRELEAIFGGGK